MKKLAKIEIRVTEKEKKSWLRKSAKAQMTLSEWVRFVLNRADGK